MLEEKMLALVKNKQLSLSKAMEKAEAQQHNWIVDKAREIKKGEKK